MKLPQKLRTVRSRAKACLLPLVLCAISFSTVKAGLVFHLALDGDLTEGGPSHYTIDDRGSEFADESPVGKRSLKFGDQKSYITIPDRVDSDFAFDNLSVSLWVKTSDTLRDVDNRAYHGFLFDCDTPGAANDWGILLFEGRVAFRIGGISEDKAQDLDFSILGHDLINDGKWHNIVVTWERTSRVMLLYMDGTLRDKGQSRSDAPREAVHVPIIGKFLGQLSDIQLYNRVLTEAEVKELFAKPGTVFKE